MIVRARAPLRLGLAGGGTDVSPYRDLHGGYVLNATIDRYAYAIIKTSKKPEIRFVGNDVRKTESLPLEPKLPLASTSGDDKLNLHKAVYNAVVDEFGGGKPIALELSTYCDAPPGSGLGSSSTLVVTMLKAFMELLNLPIDDYQMAELAYRIERQDCGLEGGSQDQYAATFGGVNFMEFYAENRAIINPLRVKNWITCELEASLLLFHTGVSRQSAQIISDQIENMKTSETAAMDAMHAIKQEALMMKESLLKADFDGIVESLRQGWENKKKTSKRVASSHIDEVYNAAISAGARAGKVSGAGGGGFMMFYVKPEKRMDVIRALEPFEGEVRNCHFTQAGAQGWRL